MKIIQQSVILITIFGICAADPLVRYQPEQIHLSLGGKLIVIIIGVKLQINSIQNEPKRISLHHNCVNRIPFHKSIKFSDSVL